MFEQICRGWGGKKASKQVQTMCVKQDHEQKNRIVYLTRHVEETLSRSTERWCDPPSKILFYLFNCLVKRPSNMKTEHLSQSAERKWLLKFLLQEEKEEEESEEVKGKHTYRWSRCPSEARCSPRRPQSKHWRCTRSEGSGLPAVRCSPSCRPAAETVTGWLRYCRR